MKKFKFELEDILNFRDFEQKQAELELGKALAVENEIQKNLENLAMQAVEAKSKVRGVLNIRDIETVEKFLYFVEQQTEFLNEKMAEAKLESEKKRKILEQCMRKKDALEKLKEKQLEEYKKELLLEEDSVTDDVVTSLFGRH